MDLGGFFSLAVSSMLFMSSFFLAARSAKPFSFGAPGAPVKFLRSLEWGLSGGGTDASLVWGQVVMVRMVVMVLGKKQDSGTGQLALRLQEEDFRVVQLSRPGDGE